MLGKLIKNEWKSTWKVPTAVCVYLFILTLIECTSFFSPLWKIDNEVVGVLAGFSMVLYILSLFGISIACFIYFVVRFYRNMYTDEGYLMHTLPVRPWQHIVSKGLVYFIWSIISVVTVMFSIFALVFSGLYAFSSPIEFSTIQELIRQGFAMLPELYTQATGMNFGLSVFMFILAAIIQLITGILMIYASISIGQTFNKHKVMASFIAYICISMAVQLVTSLISIPTMMLQVNEASPFQEIFTPTFLIGVILNVLCAVAFYFITEYTMRKKLNVD